MATLDCAFQVSFSDPSRVKVTAIKYKTAFNGVNFFELQDQPIDFHPEFSAALKSRKQLKNGEYYSITLSGATLNKYYDKAKELFWFNGRYLVTSYCESKDIDRYDPRKCIFLIVFFYLT